MCHSWTLRCQWIWNNSAERQAHSCQSLRIQRKVRSKFHTALAFAVTFLLCIKGDQRPRPARLCRARISLLPHAYFMFEISLSFHADTFVAFKTPSACHAQILWSKVHFMCSLCAASEIFWETLISLPSSRFSVFPLTSWGSDLLADISPPNSNQFFKASLRNCLCNYTYSTYSICVCVCICGEFQCACLKIHICVYIYIYTQSIKSCVPCMHACVHTYTNTHTHIHTYTHTIIHTYTHTHIQTYTHTHIHIHTHIQTTTYTHIHIYTYTYAHIHTYLPTYIHTYIITYLPACLPAYLPTYVPAYVPTYKHTHIHIYTYTHTNIHTYTHTHIHTYTYAHIHTYIHTYKPTYLPR